MRRRSTMFFTLSSRVLLGIFTIAAALSAACSSDSTTAPTSATPTTATETFSGTVGQLGTTGVPFVVSATGPVTIRLTSVAPLSTMSMGVGIATWDGAVCGTAITKNDNARSGVTALAGTATAGNYCVTVYDSGNVPEGWSVSFAGEVVHP